MMTREVLQQALEALWTTATPKGEEAIKAIKAALAQPEQEPVAGVVIRDGFPTLVKDRDIHSTDQRLFIEAPPQRKWVGLTGKEKDECEEGLGHAVSSQVFDVIEDKLKEKNT